MKCPSTSINSQIALTVSVGVRLPEAHYTSTNQGHAMKFQVQYFAQHLNRWVDEFEYSSFPTREAAEKAMKACANRFTGNKHRIVEIEKV